MALLIFMVSLENQRTAQTSGVLSKIREKSKTHGNVSKCGDILDAEIKSPPSQFHQRQTCTYFCIEDTNRIKSLWTDVKNTC